MRKKIVTLAVCLSAITLAQPPRPGPDNDPGVRAGAPGGGQPLPNLSGAERAIFERGKIAFDEADGVDEGLGPRFNHDSCGGCHAFPAVGGTAPRVKSASRRGHQAGRAQSRASLHHPGWPGARGSLPATPDGRPDGGVHNLFVITGRGDAPPGCQITQPDFSDRANIVFRIPTPAFGLGLIEAIPDATLRASLAATASRRQALGIGGRFNTNGNDGTITRFGWKAQNKSLQIFSGEAYNVEVGVTNELFPQEREERPECWTTASPEDRADHAASTFSDVELFTQFMRLLDAPRPGASTRPLSGAAPFLTRSAVRRATPPRSARGRSPVAALNDRPVNLYSDLALHRMGQRLDDGITQGEARPDEWRTAPLWGLGQRIFFLHDGRTRDLADAIRQHDSPGSEARLVIQNFNALAPEQRQDLLVFLRSL